MYKRNWIASITINGFETKCFFYGTETEFQEYAKTELGYIPRYSGATEKEVESARVLKMKFYYCPELKEEV